MKRLCYCPACGDSVIITNANEYEQYRQRRTLSNLRDGFGRPITHYKCGCGNVLAGSMDVIGWDDEGVAYARAVIRSYNEGGTCFSQRMLDAIKRTAITEAIGEGHND